MIYITFKVKICPFKKTFKVKIIQKVLQKLINDNITLMRFLIEFLT